jgi:hypothetical protein
MTMGINDLHLLSPEQRYKMSRIAQTISAFDASEHI